MRRSGTLILASVMLAGSLAQAHAEETVYKWVDENGVVHFGDSIPPEFAEQEKTILNEQGVAIGRIAGKATEEELAALRAEEEAKAEAERARRADRALLATYLTVGEIERHRDRKVEQLQAEGKLIEIYLTNTRKRLVSLLDEASAFKPYTVDPDAPMIRPALADDIKQTKDRILDYEERMAQHRRATDALREDFQVAINRYTELTGHNRN